MYELDLLSGVMVSMLALSAEGLYLIPSQVKPKTLKLLFAASLLNMQHLGVRGKTGWPRVRIMCFGIK